MFNQSFTSLYSAASPPFENQLPDGWEETVELQTNLMNNLPETLFKWELSDCAERACVGMLGYDDAERSAR